MDTEKTLNCSLKDSLGDMPTMTLDGKSIGRVDRYELLEKLGEGGFGAVYGAKDSEAGILVALKVLPAEISCDADEMATIRDNFALVSRLSHPNIAGVKYLHRVERTDEQAATALGVCSGDYLVVMEYAPGVTLFALRRAMPEQKLGVVQALEICRPIAEALDYAHSQRVLHRDIKPKNVMIALQSVEDKRSDGQTSDVPNSQYLITNNWTVKVLDFGLAAEIRSSMSRKSKDLQNSKSGTPLYMPPEQWEGKRQHRPADQYALAALFYELVSGEVPFKSAFDSGNFEIMRNAVVNNPVEPVQELTKKQNAVLLRALSKNPGDRFPSCGEFVDVLASGKNWKPRRNAKGAKNKSGMLIGLLIVGLLAVCAGLWTAGSDRKSVVPVPQEQVPLVAEIQVQEEPSPMHEDQVLMAEETSTQVSSMMREAQAALAAGDLGAAAEKAQEILQLAENHADASALLLEVEERQAREVKVDAELAVEKLSADIPDRGQGFAAKFEALKKNLLIAKDTYEHDRWGQAVAEFRGIFRDCESMRALDDVRADARKQRQRAEDKKDAAKRAKADELAGDEWQRAVASALRAGQQFEKGNFDESSEGWKEAAGIFQSSEKMAVAVSDYRKVKADWEVVAKEHKETQEEIDQHAAEEWAAAENSARLGEKCANEPILGKRHYETALAKVAEVAKKVEPFLVPRLTLVGLPDDVESILRADNGELIRRDDAGSWKLEKGKTYTLTVSMPGCKTHSESIAADWQGRKSLRVELEEWCGPEDGCLWTVDLGTDISMKFVPIAAGNFQMGSNNGLVNEKPVHEVTILKPFWILSTEVTQAQYQQIMGENPSMFKKGFKPIGMFARRLKDDALLHPVENVSWNDAVDFCKKLTERERQLGRLPEDYEYMLPTEAQWEYACRAGTTGAYSGKLDLTGWYRLNSKRKTHPVGQKKPNEWGLYDMLGNVWEWCSDWYDCNAYERGTAMDPRGPLSGSDRVLRGGSWLHDASYCRVAFRNNFSPDRMYNDLGFRPLIQKK